MFMTRNIYQGKQFFTINFCNDVNQHFWTYLIHQLIQWVW